LDVSGSRPQWLAACLVAVLLALTAASARADDSAPAVFGGHGVTFSYPLTWQHIDGHYSVQIGAPMWSEFFAPLPPPVAPPDPTAPAPTPSPTPTPPSPGSFQDLVSISAYRITVSITKKTLPRYKSLIQQTVMQLVTRGGGSMLAPGTRVTLGGLPGYRFEIAVPTAAGATLQSRIIFVFKKKVEYFFNCQSLKDGPLAAELASGCDQLTRSFRAGKH
jgi:hypothetical protein